MPTVVHRRPQEPRQSSDTVTEFVKVVVSLAVFGAIAFVLYSAIPRRAINERNVAPSRPANDGVSIGAFDDRPQNDSLPPPGYFVKGNISVTTGKKFYHVPGMRDYHETKIDASRGERWFRSEAEAVQNGWRRAVK
jgi:hypothetical protein